MTPIVRMAAVVLAGLIAASAAGEAEARGGRLGGGHDYGRMGSVSVRDHRGVATRPAIRGGTIVRDHRRPADASPYRPPDYRDPGRAPGGVVVRTPRRYP